jgi:hypothetical protein
MILIVTYEHKACVHVQGVNTVYIMSEGFVSQKSVILNCNESDRLIHET